MRPLALITTLLLLVNLPVLAQKDPKSIVMAGNQAFMDAFYKGATTLGNLYTTDALLMNANSDAVRGSAAIGEFWKKAYEAGTKRVKLETVEVEPEGNVIIEVGRYTVYGANDAQQDMGKYIVIWKKENGMWKLHRDIGNTNMPAN